MLKEVRALHAQDGFRGTAPSDAAALVGAVAPVARLPVLLGERRRASFGTRKRAR